MKGLSRILCALALLVVAVPSTHARPARAIVMDCWNQQALVPISRVQAQSYLPEGFAPSVGALGQSAVPYLYVETIQCGQEQAPELELGVISLAVEPPSESAAPEAADLYILDVVGSGARVGALQKLLCLDVLEAGEIDTVQDPDKDLGGVSTGTSDVSGNELDLTFNVVTNGTETAGGAPMRWHFQTEDGFDYFDSYQQESYISLGGGRVQFHQPYRDLPPVVSAIAFYDEIAGIIFAPSAACKAQR